MTHNDECPKCGGALLREQNTMTGTKWITYSCTRCDWWEDVDEGKALWKMLSEVREEQKAREEATADQAPVPPPAPSIPWRKLWAVFVFVLLRLSVVMFFLSVGAV
jgi:hypothetical protein